ncbi:2-oxo-4-hydroxy-4-carboxy-5-ureidoimidazoline decarboxylase [Pseudaminobacter soli (ex Li et al. 2025)]|uniref:2-oxo-4-hydroxy-4-carboxy-5-ureidoimidazoline decarboxylase n=1 Tax=Pseudaminobacter soli (ex Li et al. 2025) TaxID=1295366 RepID=A0A2P7S3T0_9HYPH|nr:2-oxo-4-hydroxy-4-carboxy-5-ureidoimidazoline decarboxylase [Mesorhizobium soli]PSJ57136.1 OHCU decarboxylase [Mesorhizobium soli]
MTPRLITEFNALPGGDFAAALAPVWENAGWVAEEVSMGRPFASAAELHEAMLALVKALPEEELLAFLNRHPDLGGADVRAGRVTVESDAEQSSIRLNALTPEQIAEWDGLNASYKARFGFPFILCVRRHHQASALAAIRARLNGTPEGELEAALQEIAWITRYRLADRIADHGIAGL